MKLSFANCAGNSNAIVFCNHYVVIIAMDYCTISSYSFIHSLDSCDLSFMTFSISFKISFCSIFISVLTFIPLERCICYTSAWLTSKGQEEYLISKTCHTMWFSDLIWSWHTKINCWGLFLNYIYTIGIKITMNYNQKVNLKIFAFRKWE